MRCKHCLCFTMSNPWLHTPHLYKYSDPNFRKQFLPKFPSIGLLIQQSDSKQLPAKLYQTIRWLIGHSAIDEVTSMFINKGEGPVLWFALTNHCTVRCLFPTTWNVACLSKAPLGIDVTSHPIHLWCPNFITHMAPAYYRGVRVPLFSRFPCFSKNFLVPTF